MNSKIDSKPDIHAHLKLVKNFVKISLHESMVSDIPITYKVRARLGVRDLEIDVLVPGVARAHSPGTIRLQRTWMGENQEFWEVVNSAAHKGWGPLLYDVAMELVSSKQYIGAEGITPDRMSVSYEARNVWKYYFNNRPDVFSAAVPSEYVVSLFDKAGPRHEFLNRFYFKRDTPILDKLRMSNQIEIIDDN